MEPPGSRGERAGGRRVLGGVLGSVLTGSRLEARQQAIRGLDVQPGCHTLDGLQSLQYARSRYYEEFRDGQWRTDPTSDLGRIGRQQNFLQQTANSTIDKLQSDPFLASELIEAGTAAVQMDPGLDPVAAAGTLRKAFSTGLNKYQLPVSGVTKDGNAVLVLDPGAEPILDYFPGVGPPPPVEP